MAQIALVTVSGRAYYRLVTELKRRGVPFLSLTPRDHIPLDVKVVITTQEERHLITHPSIMVFKDGMDPATVVNEAVQFVQGRGYDRVVIGVDPGKTFGVAVLTDGKVSEALTCSSLEETINAVLKTLDKMPAKKSIIKIGDGAPIYVKELLNLLDEALPRETIIEMVSEAGTSRLVGEFIYQKGTRDVISAIKIAERVGQVFPRRKT